MRRTRNPYDDDTSSSESDEFHRKKLLLKVKSAEERSEDENESPQQPQQPGRKHFCVICEKQFSSGKAYGGHVRIHSVEYNNKGKMKKMKMNMKKRKIGLMKKKKEIDLFSTDMEGKIVCCLCGKEFQTIHALFGHMRRHPDRNWKGVRPPPTPEDFKLGYFGNDKDVDGDDVMSISMMIGDATEDVQEAACILMMLSYTSSNCWAGMEKN